jgi:hypothetical protein
MPTLDQLLDRHKQENSAVPLPTPTDPRVLRVPVTRMADRVNQGDLSGVLPLLTRMVSSGQTYCKMVESLPASAGSAEGTALVEAKRIVAQMKAQLAALEAVVKKAEEG